jgi:hypothetical protein
MNETTAKSTRWWPEHPLTAAAALGGSALAVWGVVHWLREPRLTDEQRLEQLASLPPDLPLEALTRSVPWLRCSAATAQGSTRFDHRCVSQGSRLMILAGTLDARLASIIVHQIPAGPNLETWARGRYGAPSGSCVRDVGGHHMVLIRSIWWTKAMQTISVSWSNVHGDLPVRELVFRSRRLGQSPSCDEDTGGARQGRSAGGTILNEGQPSGRP